MEFVENSKKALEAAERRNVKESESKQVSNLLFTCPLVDNCYAYIVPGGREKTYKCQLHGNAALCGLRPW